MTQAKTRANSPFAGIIAGPTASGKSALGVEVARAHGLAIISADSMQVYRGMTIGTGAILPEEQTGVPHYLLGIADPREEFHAARFIREASAAAEFEWHKHRRRSLIVGGTGMWIQALREGLFQGPGRDESYRAELRAILSADGSEPLHALLAERDPAAAAAFSPADHVRVLRALEVLHISGRSWTDWQAEDARRRAALTDLLPLYVLDWPRDFLNDRINRRVEQMLADGWLEEARALLELGLPEHAPPRKALGYRELFAVLRGEIPLEEATPAIQQATRRFAKRQRTWFRSQRGAIFDEAPTAHRAAEALGLG